ncbi:hypothetical protein [Halobacillus trueperi]|nr:hypothetical protein [Halobacillus trueperi]
MVIEFRKDNKDLVFDKYAEAEEYLKKIKQEDIIPKKYQLLIQD